MKRATILFKLCFVVFSLMNQTLAQKDNNEEQKTERQKFLKSSSHLRFELDLGNVGTQGRHITFGTGGRFLAYHFYDNLSAEFTYTHRYRSIIPTNRLVGFSQNQSIAAFTGREMDFSLSYSIFSKMIEKEELHNVRIDRKSSTVIKLPVKTYRCLDVKLGMVLFDLPGQVEFISSQPALYNLQSVQLLQNTTSLSFGLSLKKMQHEVYFVKRKKTRISSYGEFFVDFLYSFEPSFPDALFEPVYPNGEFGEPTSYNPVGSAVYEDIKNSLEYMPYGGLLGYKAGSMRLGFGLKVLVGFRPGFVSQAPQGFVDNFSASLTIGYHIPILLKRK